MQHLTSQGEDTTAGPIDTTGDYQETYVPNTQEEIAEMIMNT